MRSSRRRPVPKNDIYSPDPGELRNRFTGKMRISSKNPKNKKQKSAYEEKKVQSQKKRGVELRAKRAEERVVKLNLRNTVCRLVGEIIGWLLLRLLVFILMRT